VADAGRASADLGAKPLSDLRTDRLRLVPLTREALEGMLGGDGTAAAALLGADPPAEWLSGERYVFQLRRDQLERDPSELPWLLRGMVSREQPPRIIGQIGFHQPPDEHGIVEVGYMTLPEHRRRGYAEEAVRGLIAWAATMPGVRGIRASVSPDNEPSLRLVEKLGFVQTGSQMDEIDGLELVFDLPVRS
jgi:RimJ/RimL family protein N-acetyltransferase